jgi:hypothetical protein
LLLVIALIISVARDAHVAKENNQHEKDRQQLPERVFLSCGNIICSGEGFSGFIFFLFDLI